MHQVSSREESSPTFSKEGKNSGSSEVFNCGIWGLSTNRIGGGYMEPGVK